MAARKKSTAGIAKAAPKAEPKFCDGLTVGQYLNIDGQKLRVIGIDADTVTMNAGGHPAVWQRKWLNDYPQSQICKI